MLCCNVQTRLTYSYCFSSPSQVHSPIFPLLQFHHLQFSVNVSNGYYSRSKVYKKFISYCKYNTYLWNRQVYFYKYSFLTLHHLPLLVILNISTHFEYKQPKSQCKRTKKCCYHHSTGRNGSFMSHIFCHNKTTARCRTSQHN